MSRMVAFRDLLVEENRFIEVKDDEEYACAGVRLNGKGAFIREHKYGLEIKKKHVQHKLLKDDIVFSTLFANKGAFAVADDTVDGAILSEKFPTFHLIDERLSLEYLWWFFRSGQLERIAATQATGMAVFSLAHLSKQKFLNLKVPVPSFDRQQHVIHTCNLISGLVEDCSHALERTLKIGPIFLGEYIDQLLSGLPKKRVGELGEYMTRNATIQPDQEYKQVTVAMNNNGLRLRRVCNGLEIRSPGQCYVEEEDLLFSRIDLRNGAIGFVPTELKGAVVTRDFPVFKFHALLESSKKYLEYVFLTPHFKEQAINASRGTTGRKKLKRPYFLDFRLPWPTSTEQNRIVKQVKKVQKEIILLLSTWQYQKERSKLMSNTIVEKLFGVDAGLL